MTERVLLFMATYRPNPEVRTGVLGQLYDGMLDKFITRDNPNQERPIENVLYNYRKAREVFLAGRYDALWTVEDDIIVPPHALQSLLSVDGDIVYGVYCFRYGFPMLNITHPETHRTYSSHTKEWRERFGTTFECSGLGWGCTLVRRRVLEMHEIAPMPNGDGGSSDSELAKWARSNGIRQMADTRVLCGHQQSNGIFLWPTEGKARREGKIVNAYRRVKALIEFSFWDDRNRLCLAKAGDIINVSAQFSEHLTMSGQAIYVTEA